MILHDLRTALWLYRYLRGARRAYLAGHHWLRVDLRPGRPATVEFRKYAPGGPR